MFVFLKMAWRNVWRNRRRSLLTIGAVVFALMVTVFTRGMQLGTYDKTIAYAVKTHTGMLQVHREGYYEEKKLEYGFFPDSAMTEVLESVPDHVSYTFRLRGFGLSSVEEFTRGVQIIGIVPDREDLVTGMSKRMKSGSYLQGSGAGMILLGETLAQNLHAGLDDELVILTQGYQGTLGAQKYRIGGTFRFGTALLDANAVFMSLQDAQELLNMQDKITEITMNSDNLESLENVKTFLTEHLDTGSYEIMSWDELMPELVQMIAFDNIGGLIMLAILVIVVAFGILNTVLMMVLERMREFGVLMSIGMKPRQVVLLIFLESLFLAVTGIFIGALLGALVNTYFAHNPIQFSGEMAEVMESYGFVPALFVKVSFRNILNQGLGFLVFALFMSLFPAVKAARFKPVEALRHV